jgi:hypothetical protein
MYLVEFSDIYSPSFGTFILLVFKLNKHFTWTQFSNTDIINFIFISSIGEHRWKWNTAK